ncbi:VIN3-like protein 2 [Nymphaea thermarum]|nr:VIN3-like protein 2 [Nymphaea thermarum]
MDPSFNGFVLDPSKCSKLTMEEKQELVYELSKWPELAPELLQSWSRRELLEVICAAMGKERKYTGLPKSRMIEHLLRIVSEKKMGHSDEYAQSGSSLMLPSAPNTLKRQRKTENPSRLALDSTSSLYCQNVACRATLTNKDTFCKRCSCCICHKYDENKDPSLWLVCVSEPPDLGYSCGMSCHLECALKHERSGITRNGNSDRLDGAFCCIGCGKVNELIGSWRKQLMVAKDARRVDTLCYRLSLSRKLLQGTKQYQELNNIVELAAKKLEQEVGPLDGSQVRMARGIVNRLTCGSEVQKLCISAIEALDYMHSMALDTYSNLKSYINSIDVVPLRSIKFEEVSPTCLMILLDSDEVTCCTIWHRIFSTVKYPEEPTCILLKSDRKCYLSDLLPATEYVFKIIPLIETKELGCWEIKYMTNQAACDAKMSPCARNGSLENGKPDTTSGQGNNLNQKHETEGLGRIPDHSTNGSDDQAMTSEIIEAVEQDVPCDSLSIQDGHLVGPAAQKEFQNGFSGCISNYQDEQLHMQNVHCETTFYCENGYNEKLNVNNGLEDQPFFVSSAAVLPCTPCKLEASIDAPGRKKRMKLESQFESGPVSPVQEIPPKDPQCGSSSKKKCPRRVEDGHIRLHPGFTQMEQTKDISGSLEGDYEYCVKVIRRLECEGHVEKNFRVKFLTWFSLRATPQERRIVSVFVDTLIDDLAGLAGQLVDTFSEGIWGKKAPVPSGFCTKLWH